MKGKIYRIERESPLPRAWINTWLQQTPQPTTLGSSGVRTLSHSNRVFQVLQAMEVNNQLTLTVIRSLTMAWCQLALITLTLRDWCQAKLETIFKCITPSLTTILMRTSTISMDREGQWLVGIWSAHRCELTLSIKLATLSMTNSLQKSLNMSLSNQQISRLRRQSQPIKRAVAMESMLLDLQRTTGFQIPLRNKRLNQWVLTHELDLEELKCLQMDTSR